MNYFKKLFLVLSGFFISTSTFAFPPIQHWQTPQGTDVYYIYSNSVPMLNIELLFTAGSYFDEKTYGLSALTNTLIGESTKTLSAKTIANGFANIGADFSTNSGRNMASIDLRTRTALIALQPALDLFHQVVTQLAFSDETLQRVKNQTTIEIKARHQDINEIAAQLFYKNLYGSSPYAHASLGSIASIQKINARQIMDFYHHYYTEKNVRVLLVGDITKLQAEKIARQITQGLPEGQRERFNPAANPLPQSVYIHKPFPANQTAIMIGNLSMTRFDSRKYAFLIANQILGGDGLTNLLSDEVREKRGLTYHISSAIVATNGLQPFIITLQTKNSTVQEASATTKKILSDFIQQGPTPDQLRMTKQFLINSFPFVASSNSSLMQALSLIVTYGYPLNYLETYQAHIQMVTADQVKTAMQVIHPNQLLEVSVGGK